jgi:hypothetical protein
MGMTWRQWIQGVVVVLVLVAIAVAATATWIDASAAYSDFAW